MRLTRNTWLLLAILALVAASASLYMVYSGKASQQGELKDKLSAADAQYSQLVSQRADLQSQLDQLLIQEALAQAALNDAAAKFTPSTEQTIDYDEILFAMAGHCQLEITSLVASAPAQIKAGYVTYMLTTFNVVVSPANPLPATADESVARILHYVHTIATGEGVEDFVNGVNIVPNFVNGTTIESVAMSNTGASITMNVHSSPG